MFKCRFGSLDHNTHTPNTHQQLQQKRPNTRPEQKFTKFVQLRIRYMVLVNYRIPDIPCIPATCARLFVGVVM